MIASNEITSRKKAVFNRSQLNIANRLNIIFLYILINCLLNYLLLIANILILLI